MSLSSDSREPNQASAAQQGESGSGTPPRSCRTAFPDAPWHDRWRGPGPPAAQPSGGGTRRGKRNRGRLGVKANKNKKNNPRKRKGKQVREAEKAEREAQQARHSSESPPSTADLPRSQEVPQEQQAQQQAGMPSCSSHEPPQAQQGMVQVPVEIITALLDQIDANSKEGSPYASPAF